MDTVGPSDIGRGAHTCVGSSRIRGVLHLDAELLGHDGGEADAPLLRGLFRVLHVEHVGEHLTAHPRVEEAFFVLQDRLPHGLEELVKKE
jgi:hypothetical protein